MLWEAISNTRRNVSSDIQTLRSWLKKSLLRLCFQPTSQCLDIWWNTLSCVWYITWNVKFMFSPFSTVPNKFSTTSVLCPWKVELGEAIVVSLQEGRNLPTGIIVNGNTSRKEFNSKLGLRSVERKYNTFEFEKHVLMFQISSPS